MTEQGPPQASHGMRTLIVGLGNPVLRDDAVGVRLARDFRKRWEGRTSNGPDAEGGHAAGAPSAGGPAGTFDSSNLRSDRAPGTPDAPDLRFIEECSLGGLSLVEQLAGYDLIILFDSIRTKDSRPGDWSSFTAAALRATMNLSNVHDANFATALELGRRLGLALPPDDRIVIFAVEIEDNLTFDERMSDALEVAYPTLSAEIFAEVERVVGA